MSKKTDYWLDLSERFLGKNVGQLLPMLGKTSCMNREYREIIVLLTHYPDIAKFLTENPDFKVETALEKIIIPLLRDLGYANWSRDILTDLALALSQVQKEFVDTEKDDKSLAELFKTDS